MVTVFLKVLLTDNLFPDHPGHALLREPSHPHRHWKDVSRVVKTAGGGGSMSWARGIAEGQQSPTPSLLSTIKRTVFTIKGYIKYKKNGHLLAFKQKNGAAFDYWAHYTIIQLAAY